MRSTIRIVLASAALVSATNLRCTETEIDRLAVSTTCGSAEAIAKCLYTVTEEGVEGCYISGGCSGADAKYEGLNFVAGCSDIVEAGKDDLRKRIVEARATGDSTTSSTSSTSAPAVIITARQADATTALVCSTTSIKPTTACSISKGETVSCTSTDTTIVSCATGIICFPAVGGEAAPCMRRDDHLTLSGLIVAIVFGASLTITLIALIVLHFRSIKRAKNDALRAAMMKTQESAMSSARPRAGTGASFTGAGKRNVSEANLPLIKPGGDRSEQSYANAPDYFAEESRASGQAPQSHPGLGAMGQERY